MLSPMANLVFTSVLLSFHVGSFLNSPSVNPKLTLSGLHFVQVVHLELALSFLQLPLTGYSYLILQLQCLGDFLHTAVSEFDAISVEDFT